MVDKNRKTNQFEKIIGTLNILGATISCIGLVLQVGWWERFQIIGKQITFGGLLIVIIGMLIAIYKLYKLLLKII